jgi:hypothetical protein
VFPDRPLRENGRMKALTANDFRLRSIGIAQALLPAAGSIMTAIGNLCTLGSGAVHGSSVTALSVHVIAVALIAPIGDKKAGI